MTWVNRIRLWVGLSIVVLVVLALTIVLSQRKGETTSTSAAIVAVFYPVGTDYAGSIVDQAVAAGDLVKVGDPIATIQSNSLLQALRGGATIASSEVYDVHADGTLIVKSTVEGIVESTDVQQGGYAASGSTIATIAATDSLFVEADFTLDPKDFARIEQGAGVNLVLPDSSEILGTVAGVEVTTVNGSAQARVKVVSVQLLYSEQGGLITPGTPVVAEMELRNDDVLARMVDSVQGFVSDLLDGFK